MSMKRKLERTVSVGDKLGLNLRDDSGRLSSREEAGGQEDMKVAGLKIDLRQK